MLQKAFRGSGLSKTGAYVWHNDIKSGCTVVEDLSRSERPPMANIEENVEKLKEIMLQNSHTSLRESATEFNIMFETGQPIVVDTLSMRRILPRLFQNF